MARTLLDKAKREMRMALLLANMVEIVVDFGRSGFAVVLAPEYAVCSTKSIKRSGNECEVLRSDCGKECQRSELVGTESFLRVLSVPELRTSGPWEETRIWRGEKGLSWIRSSSGWPPSKPVLKACRLNVAELLSQAKGLRQVCMELERASSSASVATREMTKD